MKKKANEEPEKHGRKAVTEFQSLIKHFDKVHKFVKKEKLDSPKKENRVFVEIVKKDPKLSGLFDAFVEKYLGTEDFDPNIESKKKTVLYWIRDAYLKAGSSLAEVSDKIYDYAVRFGYPAITIGTHQTNIRKHIPKELMEFLPRNIVVSTDPTGKIRKISEILGNKRDSLDKKLAVITAIVKNYNKIVSNIKKDLASPKEEIKLSALVAAIILETGIRPGKETTGSTKKREGEEKLDVETFGALNLLTSHFTAKEREIELLFLGKKGTPNKVTIKDSDTVKLLATQLHSFLAKPNAESLPVFQKLDGTQLSRSSLMTYFKNRVLAEATPKSFRALKATNAVLEKIHDEQEEIYKKIRILHKKQKEVLKEHIVEILQEHLKKAAENAKDVLSHEVYRTTIDSYASPIVVLSFLSEGRVAKNLDRIVLSDQKHLKFDPKKFLEEALKT